MKKISLFLISIFFVSLFFQGCLFFNKRGVSDNFYSDCSHYYDSRGFYKETCDENIVDYKDFVTKKAPNTYHIGF
jgi:hypothetical protein